MKPKSKTTAILLAVFLGLWTWCYTYKKDAWKFWLNLVLSILTFGLWGLVAWVWAIVNTARRPEEFFTNYNQSLPAQPSAPVAEPKPQQGSVGEAATVTTNTKVLSPSEIKRLNKWEKIRNKGKMRYILLYGVLFWGGLTGIIMSFFFSPLALLVFLIGGIFFGIWTWNKSESLYLKSKL